MRIKQWLKEKIEARKWQKLRKADKYWDEHNKLTSSEQQTMMDYLTSKWADRKERGGIIRWLIGIVISLLILIFGILNYLK